MPDQNLVSRAIKLFNEEAPQHASAWMEMLQKLAAGSATSPCWPPRA